ncbi:hypothetical protein MBLNU230_g5600t1 [Neophaeotheca triangularis]
MPSFLKWSLFAGLVNAAAVQQTRRDEIDLASYIPNPDASRWPAGLHLATEWYPSQWPESMWESDVAAMRDANLTYVRVNEFDWTILEPTEGQYNFTLLDRSVELLSQYGLKIIIGTPTATPPNWVFENYNINFVDHRNQTLLFGSRRAYSFSSFDYRIQSQRITKALAERYGDHPDVVAWQLDNEFGCHDTVRSYDQDAITRFRSWLQDKYGTIEALNEAQGRVFWSNQFVDFEAILPPYLEVYTFNQAHTLDWYRFSSDMVIEFAKEQTAIIRQYAPSQAITTNFMVLFMLFDHYKFNREVGLDFATYDQYALAGLGAVSDVSDQQMQEYLRTGLPDLQMFNQDQYRGVAGAAYGSNEGPHGVMEMQPGVLNWNEYRVSPAEGMVRLWTLETYAAKGDMVNYFRWRQPPFAQEQTLSALHTSDNAPDFGFIESQVVAQEDLPPLREAMGNNSGCADVALIFDYTADWVFGIEPYSGSWSTYDAGYTDAVIAYTDLVYNFYSALRRLGITVDVISAETSIQDYKMVVVPSLPVIPDTFNNNLADFNGPVVFGPHTGSKTTNFEIVPGLNPAAGTLRDRLPMRVTRVETPPDYANSGIVYGGANYSIADWEETIYCTRANASSEATVTSTSSHRRGQAAACANDGLHYLAFKTPIEFLVAYLGDVAAEAGVRDALGRTADKASDLGESLRMTRHGNLLWAFNYGAEAQSMPQAVEGQLIVGQDGNGREVPSYGVKVWDVR